MRSRSCQTRWASIRLSFGPLTSIRRPRFPTRDGRAESKRNGAPGHKKRSGIPLAAPNPRSPKWLISSASPLGGHSLRRSCQASLSSKLQFIPRTRVPSASRLRPSRRPQRPARIFCIRRLKAALRRAAKPGRPRSSGPSRQGAGKAPSIGSQSRS